MRSAIAALFLVTLVASPVGADQGRGRGNGGQKSARIPPGHLPPAGECRVWYDGRPSGHQPPPMDCRDAERIAARDRSARVVYGGGATSDSRGERWPDIDPRSGGGWIPDTRRGDDRDGSGRAVPRRSPVPGRSEPTRAPSTQSRVPRQGEQDARLDRVAFDRGYREGLEQGREDARLRRASDATRHPEYRAADIGYSGRYGSRAEYQAAFRQGFRAGYAAGYDALGAGGTRPGGWGTRRGGTTR